MVWYLQSIQSWLSQQIKTLLFHQLAQQQTLPTEDCIPLLGNSHLQSSKGLLERTSECKLNSQQVAWQTSWSWLSCMYYWRLLINHLIFAGNIIVHSYVNFWLVHNNYKRVFIRYVFDPIKKKLQSILFWSWISALMDPWFHCCDIWTMDYDP